MRKALALLALPLLMACGNKDGNSAGPAAPVQLAGENARRLHGVCTSPQTHIRLKELAFDEAAKRRRGEAAALDQAAAGARAAMVEPIAATGEANGGVVVCSGRLLLELPSPDRTEPRRLASQIEFAAQVASDGSGLVFELEGAEGMIGELAMLGGPLPQGGLASAAARPEAPYDGQHRAQHSTGPSFDCTRTRYASEAMICSSRPLSALDREMASLYYDRMARADERTRQLLRRSRDGFLARRDRCQEGGCIASVYEDRIAEIRRIATSG
jgi:uncharacterized protein YecT (DUF1311 family)